MIWFSSFVGITLHSCCLWISLTQDISFARLSWKHWIHFHTVGVVLTVSNNTVSLTFSCRNFSKPAAPIIAQMFNFLNLGFEGYKKIAYKDLRNARMLSRALDNTYFKVRNPISTSLMLSFAIILIRFQVLSNIHCPAGRARPHQDTQSTHSTSHSDDPEDFNAGLPVVAFQSVMNSLSEYWHTHSWKTFWRV